MPTPQRVILDGSFYHLYNRGNHKEPIFHEARDYERFLWIFTDAAREHQVDVAALCLMPNHYHALVSQREGGSLERAMRSFCVGYAKYYNRSYGQVGHLFQDRYRARLITSDADLAWVSRYIRRNPVEAGISTIEGYEWSSYQAYMGVPSRWCDPIPVLAALQRLGIDNYATYCTDVKNSEVPGDPDPDGPESRLLRHQIVEAQG
jgi:REP element-mobilizing transposase RayT